MSLFHHVVDITELVNQFKTRSIIAYGCGDGMDYIRERCHVAWGADRPYLYDPNSKQFNAKPNGKYQGLICIGWLGSVTDEQAEIALRDMAWITTQWAYLVTNRNVQGYFQPDVKVVARHPV